MGRRILLVVLLAAVSPGDVFATGSPPELAQVRDDLLAWLPGEYSSLPQLLMERELRTPSEGEHENWYGVFAKVAVPHIGENVIYGQLQIGGPGGPVVPGSQMLDIVDIDEANKAVTLARRRVKTPESFVSAYRDPGKLAAIEIEPDFGGECDFRWRRHGEQIVGRLADKDSADFDGTCTAAATASGVSMTYDTEWILNPWELWLYESSHVGGNRDEAELIQGRRDRTHTRLYKMRQFVCALDVRLTRDSEAVSGTMNINDRGGSFAIDPPSPEESPVLVSLLRGYWPKAGARGMEERLRLSVERAAAQQPLAEAWADPLAADIGLKFEHGKIACTLGDA